MRDQYEASISNAKDEARQIISDAQKSATERGEAIVADAKKEAVASRKRHLLISPRSALLHSSR